MFALLETYQTLAPPRHTVIGAQYQCEINNIVISAYTNYGDERGEDIISLQFALSPLLHPLVGIFFFSNLVKIILFM